MLSFKDESIIKKVEENVFKILKISHSSQLKNWFLAISSSSLFEHRLRMVFLMTWVDHVYFMWLISMIKKLKRWVCQIFNFSNDLRIIFFILLFFLFDLGLLHAQLFDTSSKKKKHTLSICAIFKNESYYLKEWIEYHLLVGVDHFYLYNIGSEDYFMKVLKPYVKEGVVTLVNWHYWNVPLEEEDTYQWSLAIQIPAYENAKFLASKETEWLTFVDIHEFLASPVTDRIPDVLKKYDECPAVLLKCDFFDASKNINVLPKRKFVIQTNVLTKPLLQHPQKEVVKVIFRPDCCNGFMWPPYRCTFNNFKTGINVGKSELLVNSYLNRNAYFPFKKVKEKLLVDNRSMSDEEIAQVLSLDYEIEDHDQAISRFIPELAKRMGEHIQWGW